MIEGASSDHVESADRNHLRNPANRRRRQSIAAGGQRATHQFIRKFRGRDVQHTGNQTVGDQSLHRLATIAGRVKYEHFVSGGFQDLGNSARAKLHDHVSERHAALSQNTLEPVFFHSVSPFLRR